MHVMPAPRHVERERERETTLQLLLTSSDTLYDERYYTSKSMAMRQDNLLELSICVMQQTTLNSQSTYIILGWRGAEP